MLFDFDGPLARLFAGHPAPDVARLLTDRLDEWGLLTPALRGSEDPLEVIRGFAHRDRTSELEKLLTEQEIHAASMATPTPYSDNLVRLLVARGHQVAITTNNSPLAVTRYLQGRQLAHLFGPHIHGRTHDPSLMKPHPHCLVSAMESTGAYAAECLMIGDSVGDYEAARQVGVTFLGYAHRPQKETRLRDAGASHVIRSLQDLCIALRDA
ncbi:HAD family hydrolase [Streptomyces sp. NBC_01537]|uniref:HAD family hydrolase n=1 Tax=Streptomyces sp. NBC_01537 TaxID=2903896 RepID=UPI003869101C